MNQLLEDLEEGARVGLEAYREYLSSSNADDFKKAKLGVNLIGHAVRFRSVIATERALDLQERRAISSGAMVTKEPEALEAGESTASEESRPS